MTAPRRYIVRRLSGIDEEPSYWTAAVGPREARVDDGPALEITTAADGAIVVTCDARRITTRVVAIGDRRLVFMDGHVHEFEVQPEGTVKRRRAAAAHGGLAAPMPATVVKVVAAPGADVKKGEVVLLLEAMKMELPLRAPGDGTVRAVHCAEGDLVQPGRTLMEIE